MFAFRFVSIFAVTTACLAATGCCTSTEAVQARTAELYAAADRALTDILQSTCAARGGTLGYPAEGDWSSINGEHMDELGKERTAIGVDKIPAHLGIKPPEGATAFVMSGAGGQSRQALCRMPNGDVKVLFSFGTGDVERVRECGCDQGRGTPDISPPPAFLFYWFRGLKPEQITTEDLVVPTKRIEVTHSSCGEHDAP